jgi:integrase
MGRSIHRLSALDLKRRQPGMYADGGGLVLQATAGTDGQIRRSWIFRYMIAGRSRYMGLGSIHTVSLAEAREAALQARKLLLAGTDPIEHRDSHHTERAAAAARSMTFDECVAAYVAAHRDAWRNEKHAKQWDQPLRRSISPVIGKFPVAEIDTAVIVKAIRPMWDKTPVTASRVRGRIEAILDWATVSKFRQGENPARWDGHLEHLLPAARKVAPIRHHAAMPYSDVPAFMVKLRATESTVARALEFLILTATRSGEARGATWDEIKLAEKVWTIPGARMKAGREHRVPLSPRALQIIGKGGKGAVFPGRGGGTVSEGGVKYLMQQLGADAYTAHGFRSAFRDWAGNQTNFARDVAEAALAHRVGNEVELAYRRGDALEKRRRLMDAWAAYCSKPVPTGATVTPIRKVDANG